MGLSPRLLGAGEQVVVHTRTHAKVLAWPALGLVVVGAGTAALAALVPTAYRPLGQLPVLLLGLVLLVWWCVRPFLRWWTTTYTLTTRRLLTQRGILNRTSKDLPLSRVVDVTSERSLTDRLLGCGSLVLQTAAEGGVIVLHDVPGVEEVHRAVSELLFGEDADPA